MSIKRVYLLPGAGIPEKGLFFPRRDQPFAVTTDRLTATMERANHFSVWNRPKERINAERRSRQPF